MNIGTITEPVLVLQGCVEVLQNFIMKHGLILGLLCVLALILQVTLKQPHNDIPNV